MLDTYYLQRFTLIIGLSLFSYLPLAQAATDCTAVTEIQPAECNVLVDFYINTNGAKWKDNADWNETNTPCSWKGVKCESGHVISLKLSRNKISGSIPKSLGDLSNLKILYLSHNQLSGPIPESLSKLKQLNALDLSHNQLKSSIPESLSKLNKLELFYVDDNNLCGDIPIPLKKLDKRDVAPQPPCPEKPIESVCSTVPETEFPKSECEGLFEFYISTNGAKWKDNTDWNKPKNPCSWKGVECDSSKKHVIHLVLSDNQLSGSIPISLGNTLNKLKKLDLSKNRISGSIPESLGNLKELQVLNLSENRISNSIPESLNNLQELQVLNLSKNHLIDSIPKSLNKLNNLTHLHLESNYLSNSIPKSLGELSQLKHLYLGNNQLRGSIPDSLNKLSNLTHLHLESNYLSDSIPKSLGELSQLESFNLGNNQLSGSIPKSLDNLEKLKILHLQDNQLSGSIPKSLGELSQLEFLTLGNNQFSGSIPKSLDKLSNLTHLYLGSNYLSGSIPESLDNLEKLEILHLQDNQLSGSIPKSLGKLINLKSLYLNNNRLCGNIPTSLINLDKIEPYADSQISEEKIDIFFKISENYLASDSEDLSAWLNEKEPYWEDNQGKHCPKEVKPIDCKGAGQYHPACRHHIASQSHYCENRDKYLDILDSGSLGLMCYELADWQKKAKDISLKQEIRDEFQTAVGGWLTRAKEEVVQQAELITEWSELQKFHSLENVCIGLPTWQKTIDSIGSIELKSKVREGLRNTVTENLYKWKLKVEEELHKCIKYSALVIGISDYTDDTGGFKDLKKPAEDARDIALVLRYDYGFEVKTLLDEEATKSNIQAAYRLLLANATANEYVLIFYAGHGIKKGGISYWVPTDVKANADGKSYEKTMISLDKVANSMCRSSAQKIFIVSDSCYFRVSGSEKSCPIGSEINKSRVALSSGNLFEQVLDSDPGEREGPSPFTKAFLRGLSDPPVANHFTHYKKFHTDSFFYEYFINTKFSREYGQHPQYYKIPEAGHTVGDFVFQSVFLNEHHKHQLKPTW